MKLSNSLVTNFALSWVSKDLKFSLKIENISVCRQFMEEVVQNALQVRAAVCERKVLGKVNYGGRESMAEKWWYQHFTCLANFVVSAMSNSLFCFNNKFLVHLHAYLYPRTDIVISHLLHKCWLFIGRATLHANTVLSI